MVVGKKQSRDIPERNPQLINSLHGSTASIHDELFVTNFYERAGSEAIQSRRWRPAPQQSNSKNISRWFGHGFSLTAGIICPAVANFNHTFPAHILFSFFFFLLVAPFRRLKNFCFSCHLYS